MSNSNLNDSTIITSFDMTMRVGELKIIMILLFSGREDEGDGRYAEAQTSLPTKLIHI